MYLRLQLGSEKRHTVYNPTYAISAKNKYTIYTTQPNWTDKNSESYSRTFCSTFG